MTTDPISQTVVPVITGQEGKPNLIKVMFGKCPSHCVLEIEADGPIVIKTEGSVVIFRCSHGHEVLTVV